MNKKICFLLFAVLALCVNTAFPQAKDAIKKVVIDAGHGGSDIGAPGSMSKEKDVNLAVALELGKQIKETCPDVEVYYTRKTDTYPTLYERCNYANNQHADLFISIHCNASTNKTAHGTETFVMGLDKSEHNLEVARRENASMLLEDDYKTKYGGFNPNSPESYVIFSLYANNYLDNSTKLAAKVQKNLVSTTGFPDRKVQQAGFWVLHAVAMPSILVELGFISNPEEEKKLIDKDFQKKMAQTICLAFAQYKSEVEGKSIQQISNNADVKQETKPAETNAQAKPAETKPVKQEVTAAQTDKPVEKANDNGICFKVQFCASPEDVPLNDKRFFGVKNVGKYKEKNMWKYTSGNEKTYEDAQKVLKEVKVKYPDAFIIAFKNGEKIPVPEARQLCH